MDKIQFVNAKKYHAFKSNNKLSEYFANYNIKWTLSDFAREHQLEKNPKKMKNPKFYKKHFELLVDSLLINKDLDGEDLYYNCMFDRDCNVLVVRQVETHFKSRFKGGNLRKRRYFKKYAKKAIALEICQTILQDICRSSNGS